MSAPITQIKATVELPKEDASDVIGHLLQYLASYIRECIALREENEALAARYDRLRRLFDQNNAVAG